MIERDKTDGGKELHFVRCETEKLEHGTICYYYLYDAKYGYIDIMRMVVDRKHIPSRGLFRDGECYLRRDWSYSSPYVNAPKFVYILQSEKK